MLLFFFCETQGRIFMQLFSAQLFSSKTKYNIVQVLFHTAVHMNSSYVFLGNKLSHMGLEWCEGARPGSNDEFYVFFLGELSHFNSPIWPLTSGTQVIQISNYDLKFNVRFYYLCQLEESVCSSTFWGIRNPVDLTRFCCSFSVNMKYAH